MTAIMGLAAGRQILVDVAAGRGGPLDPAGSCVFDTGCTDHRWWFQILAARGVLPHPPA